MPRSFVKDPDDRLDYRINWKGDRSPWLGDLETLATSEWFCDDPTLTIDSDSHDTTTSTVWLTGGTALRLYTVTNRITTSQGRTEDRSIEVFVADR